MTDKILSSGEAPIRKIALYFGLGQSLMEGVCRSKQVMSKDPIAPGRALMFETGERAPRVAFDPEKPLPTARFWELTDLQSRWNEEPLTEATRAILPALPANYAIVTANFGRRRMRFDRIAPSGDLTVYSNVKTALSHIAATAQAIKTPVSRLILSWIHGHADRSTDKADYRRALKSLHFNLKRDAYAVTGRNIPVLICASQTCAAMDATTNAQIGTFPDHAPVASAYVITAQKHSEFFVLACPEYFLARSFNGVHLTPQSTALLGAYHGRAIANRLQEQDWTPLQMVSAQRHGNVITVTFTGGTGPLVVHQDQGNDKQIWGVRNLKNAGFTWETLDGTPTDIKRTKITGYREITLFLRATPRKTSQESLSLGLFPAQGAIEGFVKGRPETGTGLASNIRTENAECDHFGTPLHDWALLQRIPISLRAPVKLAQIPAV